MPHAHWTEELWFAASVSGFVLTLLSLRASIVDRQHLLVRITPVLVLPPAQVAISDAIVVSTWILLTAHTWILVSAIVALFMAPPPPAYSQVPQSAIGIWCWIGLSVTLSIQAIYGRMIRNRLSEGFYERQADQVPQRRATDPPPP